jgi:hypothetical protein
VERDNPGEGEAELVRNKPVHVEAPCVQRIAADGVAQRSAGLEHACVSDFDGNCDPAGACGSADSCKFFK